MARSGITYTEVADVCEQIRATGERPTVDRIRTLLGTGSRTTINTHKNTWEARQDRLQNNPHRISDTLAALVSQLSEQLHAECQAVYDQQSAQDAVRMAEQDQQFDEVARRLESLQQRLEQARSEKEQLANTLEQRQQVCEKITVELQRAQTQLEEREQLRQLDQQQLIALTEKNQQQQRAFEHYQESVREQRDRDLNLWDQEKAQLQADIRALRDQLASISQQLFGLNRDNGVLITEKTELTRQLRAQEQQNHELRVQFQEAQTAAQVVEKSRQERQTRFDLHSERLTELVALTTRQEMIIEQQNREQRQAEQELARLRALLTEREAEV